MDALDFIRRQMSALHRLFDHVISDLSSEQLNHQAQTGVQSIAFSLWHYVRTEDNIVQFVIQRRQTVWIEGGWPQRFGLDARSQGTGMSEQDAAGVRITDLDAWRQYQSAVWDATDAYLSALSPDGLEQQRVTIRPVGEMGLLDALGGMVLTHGYRHLGEIEYARGLVGLRGATI